MCCARHLCGRPSCHCCVPCAYSCSRSSSCQLSAMDHGSPRVSEQQAVSLSSKPPSSDYSATSVRSLTHSGGSQTQMVLPGVTRVFTPAALATVEGKAAPPPGALPLECCRTQPAGLAWAVLTCSCRHPATSRCPGNLVFTASIVRPLLALCQGACCRGSCLFIWTCIARTVLPPGLK